MRPSLRGYRDLLSRSQVEDITGEKRVSLRNSAPHKDIDVFIGVDAGKGERHAIARDRSGKRLFGKALSHHELKMRASIVEPKAQGKILDDGLCRSQPADPIQEDYDHRKSDEMIGSGPITTVAPCLPHHRAHHSKCRGATLRHTIPQNTQS